MFVSKRRRVRLSVRPSLWGSARASSEAAQQRAMRIVGCIRQAGRVNLVQ